MRYFFRYIIYKKNFTLFFSFFVFNTSILFSQNNTYLDSLFSVWENPNNHDTVRLKAIDDFIWDGYLFSNPDSALYFSQLMYDFTKKNNLIKYQGIALKNSASAYFQMGDYKNALMSYKLSLVLFQKIDYPKGMVSAYANMGQINTILGSYNDALNYYFKALKIGEVHKDKVIISNQMLNIGVIYQEIHDFEKALEFYNKAIKYFHEIDSKYSIVTCKTNIGTIFVEQNKLDEAEKMFDESLEMLKTINNENNKVYCYNYKALINLKRIEMLDTMNISAANIKAQKDSLFNVGFESAYKAIDIGQKIKANFYLCSSYDKLGKLFFLKNNTGEAEKYYLKSLALAKEIDSKSLMSSQYENLSELYYKKGDFKKAFENYKGYKEINDSLLSINNSKVAFQKELEHSYEKKEAERNVKLAEEKKVIQERFEKEKIQRISLYGGLGLVSVFLFFVFNRLKVARKQKQIIEHQKQEVEQQNLEITSSIRYAKRIQAAILPPSSYIDSIFEKYYIIYKPKDIVAGDFYWFDKIDQNIIFAAADCTGHGVPGAMVSVVCNNALNRCVREFGILDPGKILDKAREIIISEFQKSEEELQDGMDISLCVFNVETYKLLWAGANNPLWIIRNGELIELKPDKQPIGKYSHQKKFTTHEMQLEKEDLLYVFTDGYQDQFGGKEGKKFKVSNLKKLLLEVSKNNIDKQKSEINAAFESWKAGNVQVDDVCLIAVKV